ncbi:hypothetical protein CBLAS_1413 [Campylobacter blaseri]|uniref:Uncharacterized protein n=1 Tax=Campylobacter blaseri TaxID=2042961 RepID=A0A2P8QYC9_9BACT|nr:hypothetical protein [Campylobacter blaseri]PSM51266.1 hypothetical protein CQ405_09115 [Campylobacter blaseri]PSM52410.1 hypothetical protein CRN67_09120 [Campylobacter blaseri]QKF86577.1 hypothetical protein CBLAS_1413 [Campylobacter blaseri]
MKKTLIALSIATSLYLNNLNAGGIPTIDVAAIAQAVVGYTQTLKDYAEQIKQYEQMVQDTLNFEKQMKELGVDMNDVNQILGDVTQMINSMKDIYSSVKNIPEDIMGDVARVKMACSFLETNSQFFGISVKTSSNKLTSKINQCTYALRNGVNLSKSIEEITAKMNASIDPIERANYKAQIANIKNAEKFLQARENATKTDALLAFEDVFHKEDKTNSYSKAKMNDDLNKFAKQLSKANNQKQAQALTNSLLLKILENLQHQYELNINYTSTMASSRHSYNNSNKNLTEESFNKNVVEYKRNDNIFEPETKQLPKDELGLPKFIFKRSN